MKDYFQFISNLHERLAIEDNPNAYIPPTERYTPTAADRAFDRRQERKYGALMARIAARELAKSQAQHRAQSARQPFPWNSTGYNARAGWWHPTKQWFTFLHAEDGYHVTQIVKSPAKFGVSNTELQRALEAEANRRNENNLPRYGKDGTEYPWTAADIKAAILKEDIDLSYAVQRLAYMKGWLKVYSATATRAPSLEGINGESIRAALREINESGGDIQVVMVERVGLKPGTSVFKQYNPNEWRTAQ